MQPYNYNFRQPVSKYTSLVGQSREIAFYCLFNSSIFESYKLRSDVTSAVCAIYIRACKRHKIAIKDNFIQST
jgi:hypothetical protein